MYELIPCLGCGKDEYLEIERSPIDEKEPFNTSFRVSCWNCNVHTQYHIFKNDAIDSWNNREVDIKMVRFIGIKKVDEKVLCDKCGTDVSKSNMSVFMSHYDTAESFGSIFECQNCSNLFKTVIKRTGLDLELWSSQNT